MSQGAVVFDEVRDLVNVALDAVDVPECEASVYIVRDIFGKVGLSVSEDAGSEALRHALERLAEALQKSLGAHGRPAERAVLWLEPDLLDEMRDTASEIRPGIYWVDRLLVGDGWFTVGEERRDGGPVRYAFHSVKGGMGRSTTVTVLAWHLARRGERVLAIDLDLESPGLASAVLEEDTHSKFGVADWFVEELTGQGDAVLRDIVSTPRWVHDLVGTVWIAPAHGRDPGEYLSKLGRVYMDTAADPWLGRLERLLRALEDSLKPTVVLVESRSGLHDVAAATVAGIGAEVVLFAVDSASAWTGYGILFDHWRAQGLAPRIRDRLSLVSALTPEVDTKQYLGRFREHAWNLFRDRLYDPLEGADDAFDAVSYALRSDDAPHNPLVVHWNRGFAAGASLRCPEDTVVELAYSRFLRRFDRLHDARVAGQVNIGVPGGAAESGKLHTGELRLALGRLPEGTSYGPAMAVEPKDMYVPPSHRKAIHPDVSLVTGMRGAGKTFWWLALQNLDIREMLAGLGPELTPMAGSEICVGFGATQAPDRYPGRDELRAMLASRVDPRIIWRSVHALHLAHAGHPLASLGSWMERVHYVTNNPEEIARLLHDRDEALDRRGTYSLMLCDGLDHSADVWSDMFKLVRGLLRHALDMRSSRRLRVKVFLRSDQAEEERVADFPDSSKVFSSTVSLAWRRRDLYGMLWQYLGNGHQGGLLRLMLERGDWPIEHVRGRAIFRVPLSLAFDEELQRERFHLITGPWMGRGHKRGFPYTWIPNHLGDASGAVSPRSFITALRTAAHDTAQRYGDHDHALHYESVKRGVQEASKVRVGELREDYPWVQGVLGPLSGKVVPCEFGDIEETWGEAGVLDRLSGRIEQGDVRLAPRNVDRGAPGIRQDLESLGVFRRLDDGRVDVPDVFRVGYGLGRRGGVRPVQ